MAHNLDFSKGRAAFVSFAAPAWHGLGTVMQNAVSTEDALKQGGLDYNVIKMPNIHAIMDLTTGNVIDEIISDESFFTYRTDCNKVLGSKLGKDYTVMQNIDALNIVDEILQSGTCTIETAGAIDEGRKVFICLKVNKSIVVNGTDLINQYILICNSHDGSLSVTIMPTNIRVVCNNTLSAALRGSKDKIKIRHTINANDRLSEAAKVLKLITNNTAANEDNYNTMAQTVISKQEMFDYFGNVFFTPEEIKELRNGKRMNDVISTLKVNQLDEVLQFANTGQGQSLAMKGSNYTMWSAYNAVTGYITRKKYSSVSDRTNSMLFGGAADKINLAGTLALEPAKIISVKNTNFGNLNLN